MQTALKPAPSLTLAYTYVDTNDFADLLGATPAEKPKRRRGRPRKAPANEPVNAEPEAPADESISPPAEKRGPGRPPLPMLTGVVRAAVLECFERIGGVDRFAAWANAHPTEFYKMFARAAPKESEIANRAAGVQVNIVSADALRYEAQIEQLKRPHPATLPAIDVEVRDVE